MKISWNRIPAPATVTLAVLAALCGVLISTVNAVTKSTIEANQQGYVLKLLEEVTGDAADTLVKLNDELYYTSARGIPSGYVFQHVTHDGYNGTIRFWVAVDSHQVIRGVRVIAHQETPGIGDRIDIHVSGWIKQFNEKNLIDSSWSLTRDGGSFDHFTGATITSRAMVRSVGSALVLARDMATEWENRVDNEQR